MSKTKEPVGRKKEPIEYTKIIKIIDPAFQTLLIILIFYLFDRKGNKYLSLLANLIRMQVASSVLNLFLKFSGKLKLERYLAIPALIGWILMQRYYMMHYFMAGKEAPSFSMILGNGLTNFNIYEIIIVVTGAAVSIWYFTICIREIQVIMKKKRKVKRG